MYGWSAAPKRRRLLAAACATAETRPRARVYRVTIRSASPVATSRRTTASVTIVLCTRDEALLRARDARQPSALAPRGARRPIRARPPRSEARRDPRARVPGAEPA